MLELLRELFPVLVLLYLVDGFTYVNLYHLIFSSTFGGLCKSHNNTSFHLNLFPSGYIIPSHDFPLAVSAQGISFPKANLSANALLYSADDFVRMPYSSMKEIKPFAKQVQINGQTIFKAPAPTFAEQLVKDLNHFSATKDSQRIAEVEKWQKKQFNVQFAEQQEKKASHYRSILAPLTLTYFVATFVLLPLALFTEAGDYLSLSRLLYLILANYIIIILTTLYFSGQLYATTVATTIYENLSLILSPISAIRAGDHLVHNLFVQFDYLVAAGLVLSKSESDALLRRDIYRTRHFASLHQGSKEGIYWQNRLNAITQLLASRGDTLQKLFSAPQRSDPQAHSYCPVCQSEYLASAKQCSDCHIELEPF